VFLRFFRKRQDGFAPIFLMFNLGSGHKRRPQSRGEERFSSVDILRTRGFSRCAPPNRRTPRPGKLPTRKKRSSPLDCGHKEGGG